jgi:molecular chaperone GrpE
LQQKTSRKEMLARITFRSVRRTVAFPSASSTNSASFRWFSNSEREDARTEDKADTTSEDSDTTTEDSDPLAEMTLKCEQLEASLAEEKEESRKQYMSILAEMENVRRIAKNDVEKSKQYGIEKFAKSLLPTCDNLQRALESTTEDSMEGASPTLLSLYEGVIMTEKELMKVLNAQGIERFGEVGEQFDPNKYEAMFEYEDNNLEPGSVGQVITVGYTFKDRVLRPSQVGYVKKT